MSNKKFLFGWTNIKWAIKELIKTLSSKPSYFSKKRLESGAAFVIGQLGMIFYLIYKISEMDMLEMAGWASIQFAIAGYIVGKIQEEKKTKSEETPSEEERTSDYNPDLEQKKSYRPKYKKNYNQINS